MYYCNIFFKFTCHVAKPQYLYAVLMIIYNCSNQTHDAYEYKHRRKTHMPCLRPYTKHDNIFYVILLYATRDV